MRNLLTLVAGLALLAACAAPPERSPSRAAPIDLPPMLTFGATRPVPPQRSNAEIARNFIELSFELETGDRLPVLSRFEGPIGVRLAGPVPATASVDLDRLIGRLQSEAGINIFRTSGPASITVEFLPRATMQAYVPKAACFVEPGISSWREYLDLAGTRVTDWTKLVRRERAVVFIPNDTAPQEIRDCLHEEIAQALGPLNDLYELPDSVFNDDNLQPILTGFDMLILRATYAPELASGMTRQTVAAALPRLLARLNPAGERRAGAHPPPTPRAYVRAVESALGPTGSLSSRRSAAGRALSIARSAGWRDERAGFAYYVYARLNLGRDAGAAAAALVTARNIFSDLPGGGIQTAHVNLQLATLALNLGEANRALELARSAEPAARRAENAALLAELLRTQAAALAVLGQTGAAQATRLDSLGWARYGFGSSEVIASLDAEFARLERLAKEDRE